MRCRPWVSAPEYNRALRHLGWPATRRRAREWHSRTGTGGVDPWGLSSQPQPVGEFDVRVIRTSRKLQDEGTRMRDCAGSDPVFDMESPRARSLRARHE